MNYKTLLNNLGAENCVYYAKKMISFKGNGAKLDFERGLPAEEQPLDSRLITITTVYATAQAYFAEPRNKDYPYIAFPVWSYSELCNVRDSATEEVRKIPNTHYTAIIVDKGLNEIIFFEPMAEEEGATDQQREERRRTWPKAIKELLGIKFKKYSKYITYGQQGQAEATCGPRTINFILSYSNNRAKLVKHKVNSLK